MRASFINYFLLIVASIILISASLTSVEDEEGSGSDLESDGSGDEALKDSRSYKLNVTNNTSVVTDAAAGHRHSSQNSYTFDPNISPWGETEPEPVMLHRGQHFWQNKDILYAVIAGGVAGTIIAAAIMAFLIHKWQKEEKEEYLMYERRKEERQRRRIATTVL